MEQRIEPQWQGLIRWADPANGSAVSQACDEDLALAQQAIDGLVGQPPGSGWLLQLDTVLARLEDGFGPAGFLGHVHPDAAVRAASEACDLRWQSLMGRWRQHPGLWRALKEAPVADEVDERYKQELLADFEDAGVGLPAARQRQVKTLQDRLFGLGQAFERRLRDDSVKLAFTAAELVGLPADWLAAAERDPQGRWLLGVDDPTYFLVLESARLEATRARMYRAGLRVGVPDNLQRIDQMTRLRRENARLFGLRSHAEWVLRRRMARGPAQVQAFLDTVQASLRAREQAELAVLRQAKATDLGRPLAQVRLQRWDEAYYLGRERQRRWALEGQALRRQLPPEAALAWVMRLSERLFGLRFERRTQAKLWHPDAEAWLVRDASDNRPLGLLATDLHPRPGKYGHAAVWSIRQGSQAQQRLPVSALVANLDRRGLDLQQLETLLHEFGHVLHNTLAKPRYHLQGGLSTRLDFVEAPSQMLEDWAYRPEALALLQEVCPRCEAIPDAEVTTWRQAQRFGLGLRMARQHLLASYDLRLHGPQALAAASTWSLMERASPLGHVVGTQLPASFPHLAGSYAGSYYAYLWSLALATDLRSAFAGASLDPEVGQRYRRRVLEPGAEREPRALMRDFLGREPDPQALLRDWARP